MSESIGSEAVMPAINAHLAADLIVEGEQMPVFVWTVDHPAGRVLVDTGMIDSRPEIDDMSPTPHPENIPRDVACVINTHLHWDHCGGNRLFPGVPIHVQARELADARSLDNYTIREWVDFDGATYVEHEGEAEVLPGIRLLRYDDWSEFWPGSEIEPFATFINDVAKYVASSTPLARQWHNAAAIEGGLVQFVQNLKNSSGGDIGVHASISVAQALLAADAIDEVRLVVAPAIAGRGRRLLDGLPPIRLESLRSATSPRGYLLADYRVSR
jgi:dihydrofolate reductase